MHLPIQSRPVHRTNGARPFVNRGNSAAIGANGVAGGQGVGPLGDGVEPCGWLDDVLKVVTTVAPIALPALGI